MSVAASIRHVRKALQDWGEANDVSVGFRNLRDPLDLELEDEKVLMRVMAQRSPIRRKGQSRHLFVFEFHCISKRGDLRSDGRTDRAEVLGSMLEQEFMEKDIAVYDVTALQGGAGVPLGSLQFLSSSWRNGDQRGTIYGDSVDYTLETPKVEHWVVQMTASLNA